MSVVAEITSYSTLYIWGKANGKSPIELASYWFDELRFDKRVKKIAVYRYGTAIGMVPIRWLTNN